MPKVSVIIPVYNVEKYLKECLDSIINQTLKDIEIICIDDGSTDNSPLILKEYKDNRIKIITQKNSGAGTARNIGIKNANGDYLYFLDSDDLVDCTIFEKMYNQIIKENADICLCNRLDYDELEKTYKEKEIIKQKYIKNKKSFSRKDIPNKILQVTAIPCFTKLYRKDFILENNIEFQEIKVANDVYFNCATLALADKITYVTDYLMTSRRNRAGALTEFRGKYINCILLASSKLKEYYKQLGILNKIEKSFYNLMLSCFIYEIQKCKDENQKREIEFKFKEFLPNKYWKIYKKKTTQKKTLFNYENDCVHKIFTIFGIKIKFKADKCPPPDKISIYLKNWYKEKTGCDLDLENPKTFNEKIQWLKFYDNTPLKTRLADKYEVREWIKEKIGEEYLIPLLGVWDKFEDIDFDKLPDKFVLKANHGCAMNIIVKDKNKFDKKEAARKFKRWLKTNFAYRNGLELHYKDIKPKIIAEAYIEDSNKELNDYKIICFNGKPEFVWIDKDRYINHIRNIYNTKWELQPFNMSFENIKDTVPTPKNLDKMIELAEILSKDFKLVRVDFYNVDGKIYFGEMTFTPGSGIEKFTPDDYNYKLGEMLKL